MADGALFGSQCMATQDAANDAYFSAALPATVPGPTSYYASYQKATDGWHLNTYSMGSGGSSLVSSVLVTPVTFPTCDTVGNFNDGMTMGWGLVAAMAVAFGFVALKRAL